MTEPVTRPPVIAQADIDRLVKALESSRGGSIKVTDPRVSSVQTWLLGLVGTGAIGSMLWMANSIDNLSRNMERSNVRIEYIERDVAALKGRP